jgi:hypothetical protein
MRECRAWCSHPPDHGCATWTKSFLHGDHSRPAVCGRSHPTVGRNHIVGACESKHAQRAFVVEKDRCAFRLANHAVIAAATESRSAPSYVVCVERPLGRGELPAGRSGVRRFFSRCSSHIQCVNALHVSGPRSCSIAVAGHQFSAARSRFRLPFFVRQTRTPIIHGN